MYYSTLIIITDPTRNTRQAIDLRPEDLITVVDGGLDVTFKSSPATTTFYPWHRIWEYQRVDRTKLNNPPPDSTPPQPERKPSLRES